MHWNKRGQFFLIAALVTIMILFTLTVQYNTIKQTVALEDFKELSEGYGTEQPKVINLAIQEGETSEQQAKRLQNFTKEYSDYARQKEPSFGIFYAYRDAQGNIYLVNSLQNTVLNIHFYDPQLGKQATIQLIPGTELAPGTVGLEIGGQQFGTTVTTGIESYGSQLSATQLRSIDEIQIVVPGVDEPISLFAPCWSKAQELGQVCADVFQQAGVQLIGERENQYIAASLTSTAQ